MSDQTPDRPDLSKASNPRALSEAEAAWFGPYAADLQPGTAIYAPHTGGRMALVKTISGALGLVDLYDKPQTEAVTKAAPREPQEAKLDPQTAALFRSRTEKLKAGQSIVLDGGATIRRDAAGELWLTA